MVYIYILCKYVCVYTFWVLCVGDQQCEEGTREMGSSLVQIPTLPHLQENRHDPATVLDTIKACGKQKNLQKGRKIHAHLLLQQDLLSKDIYIRNALLTMYSRCGAFEEAQKLFNEQKCEPMSLGIYCYTYVVKLWFAIIICIYICALFPSWISFRFFLF